MKTKIRTKRIIAGMLALFMLFGSIPFNSISVQAATGNVKVDSLGKKGSVSYGSKTKSGTWFQMKVAGKRAFCLSLGKTCHTGNTYESTETYKWDQNTGGERHGYYAKIIRWYVNDKKRSKKAFIMSQALMWSVSEDRTSETQLKDVIKQVKSNTGYWNDKTVDSLYDSIFKPSGSWTAEATYWKKQGSNKSYQTLITVDADETTHDYSPKYVSKDEYYRQRITVKKVDEDGKGLSGIQFTLDAKNIDELYSFEVTDRDGTDLGTADTNNDTEFSITGYTRNSGRIAWRMTYYIYTEEYAYYPDDELKKMSAEEKKAAKKVLKDDYELDEGVDFGKNMTKAEAEKLMNDDLNAIKESISNSYTLIENSAGENKNIVLDPVYAKGVDITLGKNDSWYRNADGSWPDMQVEIHSDYEKAYQAGVTNKYKKASIRIEKYDGYSADGNAHGEADLDGAKFQLYADAACQTKATVYDASGNAKIAGEYTIKDKKCTTDYLRSGVKYYLKETAAPKGYVLSDVVKEIQVDASAKANEFTIELKTEKYPNTPILGKVAIQKYYSDVDTGLLEPESNTMFQVYLKNKGSYDQCTDYERATIKTDRNGYAVTGNLYYGTYVVHQVDSGDVDAIHVNDFEVAVTENGKVYTYPLNNKLFKAYLKILKKDKQTEKQVLKPGTTYQIYKVTEDGEELVKQSYSNGNQMKTIDTFITDESGEIMTVKPLRSARYRIYEVDSANGLHITEKFIEVVINSKADNYESYVDEDGNTHAVITVTYTNEETYGKLSVFKTGEMLTGWDKDKKEFVYENKTLKGAKFEIYADGDIATQDNQGDTWFRDGDKVATIITGDKVEFASDCKGICNYSVDDKEVVHLTLPLGKYKVKEVKTLYGYVFPEKNEWNLEFTWKNGRDEFVINSTSDTNDKGELNLHNKLARPQIQLLKEDADTKQPIRGAVFGLYTKHDIFNVDGEKIVDAGTELTTLTTGTDGSVISDMMLPLMDEADTESGSAESVSGSAVSVEAGSQENEGTKTLNSGEYYLKELSVSDSYYLDQTEIPVKLTYKDEKTPVIYAQCVKSNKQTTNEIDKVSVADSKELAGCNLRITDGVGKEIISWTSGSKDSVKVSVTPEDGYQNLKYSFDENGNLHVGGLFHDKEYTLTETKPADGYVTAEAITYMLKQKVAKDGTVTSVVNIKQKNGTYLEQEDDKTVMKDGQTHIQLLKLDKKTGQALGGAKFVVMDSKGNEVMKFVTKDDAYDITGKLVVGETYTFKETSAPSGYRLAKPVKVTIKDTGDVQKVTVKDESIPEVPDTPQTGGQSVKGIVFGGLFIILLVIINIVEKVSVTKK